MKGRHFYVSVHAARTQNQVDIRSKCCGYSIYHHSYLSKTENYDHRVFLYVLHESENKWRSFYCAKLTIGLYKRNAVYARIETLTVVRLKLQVC
jgi:hypothetical protein